MNEPVAQSTVSSSALEVQAGADSQMIADLEAQAITDQASIGVMEAQAVVDQQIITELAEQGVLERGQIANLEAALITARRIGAEIGIMMASKKLTTKQAFEVLKRESQCSHRKLRDVAEDVLFTGATDS